MQYRRVRWFALLTAIFFTVTIGCSGEDGGANNGASGNNDEHDAGMEDVGNVDVGDRDVDDQNDAGGGDITDDDGGQGNPPPESGALAMGDFETPGTITRVDVSGPSGQSQERYGIGHPIEVTVDVEPEEGWENRLATEPNLHVGLVERVETEEEKADARTCYLGALNRNPRSADILENGVVRFSHTYYVPPYCLADDASTGIFNIWVALNPARHLVGEQVDIPRVDFNTQFFNPLFEDTDQQGRNQLCVGGGGQEGCVIDVVLESVEGLNVTSSETKLESDVFIFDRGICEYGDPDYALPVARASSSLSVAGDFPALEGLERHSTNVLGLFGGNVEVTYDLCPRDPNGQCVSGSDYLPVPVAESDGSGGSTLVNGVAIDSMTLGSEHVAEANLFVEPGTPLCSQLAGWGQPDWSDYRLFNLRICTTPDFEETSPSGDPAADNCTTRILRMVPIEETTGGVNYSAVRDITKVWETDKGNDVASIEASFGSENKLDTDGAYSRAHARAAVDGWIDFILFEAVLEARSYINGRGSGASGHVELLDRRLWSEHKDGEDVSIQEDVEFSKKACVSYNYGVGGFGLNVSLCASGRAGVEMSVDVQGQDGAGSAPFDQSDRHGHIDNVVRPYEAFTLDGDASVDVGVARGGLRGTVDLIEASLPIQTNLAWGREPGPVTVVTYDVGTDLVTRILSGYLEAYVDAVKLGWCDCGTWCGYPCRDWSNVVNERIISFTASERTRPLLDISNSNGTTLID